MIRLAIANEQSILAIDEDRLRQAVEAVIGEEHSGAATISLAVIDDATIHQLNRRYLDHDEPTDVLSFVLEADEQHLEGEVVVSAETALAQAARFGWAAENELLLYVIHGLLHLVGYDDKSPPDAAVMRQREAHYLNACGIELPPQRESGSTAAPGTGESTR